MKHGGVKAQPLAAVGVVDDQLGGVQGVTGQLERALVFVGEVAVDAAGEHVVVVRAVQLVAQHGEAQGAEMHPNLVLAAAVEGATQQAVAPTGVAWVVAHLQSLEAGGAGAAALFCDTHFDAVAAVAIGLQGQFATGGVPVGDAPTQGEVVFFDPGALLELDFYRAVGGAGARQQQHSAGFAVEPVGEGEVVVGALLAQHGGDGGAVVACGGVYRQKGGFVDGEQGIVFEYGLQLYVGHLLVDGCAP